MDDTTTVDAAACSLAAWLREQDMSDPAAILAALAAGIQTVILNEYEDKDERLRVTVQVAHNLLNKILADDLVDIPQD